ncbi:ketopantoate reductase family protein [Brevibacillus sp. H7]|uniref:ketopantoate reductase family protein n=1 Tax=Brevibacillus sp. H7 TaxID=3349138 RepID=UPI0038209A36
MHVVVIGGGSVGLLLAARLRIGGQSVELVTRSREQAEQINRDGILLRRLDGGAEKVMVPAGNIHSPLPSGHVYLLAVKQTDVSNVIPLLRHLPRHARVLALQNGMGHHELLSDALFHDQCFFAINTEGARRVSPTEVQHTGSGLLRIGPWDRQDKRDLLISSFVEKVNDCGIPAVYADEISSYAWRKLVANALINPLTALFEVPNGTLLDSFSTLQLMRDMFAEAAAVAASCGQKIHEPHWQEIVTICRNTSQNYSSMLQDVWKGKPTEIDSINGFLVRQGKRAGISTPLHETVLRAILLKTTVPLLRGRAKDGRIG